MIFPSGAMALGGVVSQSVIGSDGVMPPGLFLSGKARKRKWYLRPILKAGRVGVDERWFGSENGERSLRRGSHAF